MGWLCVAKLLVIGLWPNPLTNEIITLLKRAADPAGVEIEYGPGWHTWTIHDERELLGAAHTRRTTERIVEVHLVGGREPERWLAELDAQIGAFARDEGAIALRAFGRRGWARLLKKQGWAMLPLDDGGMAYERGLA